MENIAINTIKSYNNTLKLMKRLNIDLDNIEKIDEILDIFNANTIKITIQKVYLCGILSYWRNKKDKTEKDNKLIEDIRKKISSINDEIIHNENKQELTEREEHNYVSWENIANIYEYIKDVYSKNEDDKYLETDILLLSFYIYHPPRRILDYSNLYYIKNLNIEVDPHKILWTNQNKIDEFDNKYSKQKIDDKIFDNKINITKNYYTKINDNYYFIFCNYKTKKTYGTQIIEVSNELKEKLNHYIEKKDLKDNQKILNITYNNFVNRLTNIFTNTLNKKISASLLRHIYINYAFRKGLFNNLNDQYIISCKMAHSIEMQMVYKRKVSDELESKIFEINKNNKLLNRIVKDININSENRPKSYNKYKTELEKNIAREQQKKEWYLKKKNQSVKN